MNLEKRIRIAELKASIALLSGAFATDEETAALVDKKAELEVLLPTPPPRPLDSLDLRCDRASILEDIARLEKKSAPLLAQLERETDRGRRMRLEYTDPLSRLRAAQDRLVRWDAMAAYNVWRADQETKRG